MNLCSEHHCHHHTIIPYVRAGVLLSSSPPTTCLSSPLHRLKDHQQSDPVRSLRVPMEDKVEWAVIGQLNYVLFPYCDLRPHLWELTHLPSSPLPQSSYITSPLLSSPFTTFDLRFYHSTHKHTNQPVQHLSLCSLQWKHKYLCHLQGKYKSRIHRQIHSNNLYNLPFSMTFGI